MQRQWKITGLIALVLFLLFALCILGVLLTGADVYNRITDADQTAYDQRTAIQYLTTKIRQSDEHGKVSVVELDGLQTLQLQETVGTRTYLTYIYCMDGYLWELYAREDHGLSTADGTKVMAAEQMKLQWLSPVLTIDIEFTDGSWRQAKLTLRSEQEMIA